MAPSCKVSRESDREVDSISGTGSHQIQKFNQLHLVISMKVYKEYLLANIFKSIEATLDNCFPSEDMEDFLNLQGKLEPTTLTLFDIGFFLTVSYGGGGDEASPP